MRIFFSLIEPSGPSLRRARDSSKNKKSAILLIPYILLAFFAHICPNLSTAPKILRPLTNFSYHKITVNNTKPSLIWEPFRVLLPIDENTTPCIYHQIVVRKNKIYLYMADTQE